MELTSLCMNCEQHRVSYEGGRHNLCLIGGLLDALKTCPLGKDRQGQTTLERW